MSIIALLAGLLSGISAAMGMGGGTVLIIYLTIFTDNSQLLSQGINLLFFIPIGVISVIIYSIKKKIKWKTILIIAAWGLLGSIIGLLLTRYLGGNITAKIFGGLLIIIGLTEIFGKKKPHKVKDNKLSNQSR